MQLQSADFTGHQADKPRWVENIPFWSVHVTALVGAIIVGWSWGAFFWLAGTWDRGLIEALTGQRLAVVSPVGIERMPTEALSRAVQERWRLVKRRAEPIESVADLRDALHMMYGSWSDFCAQVRTTFHGWTVPGIVGSCVVMSRAFANQIGGWDARVQAADWDLYLRLAQRAREQGDVAPPMVAGWVYVHHYVQATRRGERAPFTCTHPRLTGQEKWGEAAIRRWFFDPPLLAPPRLREAPAAYLGIRARRFGKDVRRTIGDLRMLARGFPGPGTLRSRASSERPSTRAYRTTCLKWRFGESLGCPFTWWAGWKDSRWCCGRWSRG